MPNVAVIVEGGIVRKVLCDVYALRAQVIDLTEMEELGDDASETRLRYAEVQKDFCYDALDDTWRTVMVMPDGGTREFSCRHCGHFALEECGGGGGVMVLRLFPGLKEGQDVQRHCGPTSGPRKNGWSCANCGLRYGDNLQDIYDNAVENYEEDKTEIEKIEKKKSRPRKRKPKS